MEVQRIHTDGNTAIAEMAATGTHNGNLLGIAPTGKRVNIVICNVMEVRDGRIYREREYLDMFSMLSQIGVVSLPGRAAGA